MAEYPSAVWGAKNTTGKITMRPWCGHAQGPRFHQGPNAPLHKGQVFNKAPVRLRARAMSSMGCGALPHKGMDFDVALLRSCTGAMSSMSHQRTAT